MEFESAHQIRCAAGLARVRFPNHLVGGFPADDEFTGLDQIRQGLTQLLALVGVDAELARNDRAGGHLAWIGAQEFEDRIPQFWFRHAGTLWVLAPRGKAQSVESRGQTGLRRGVVERARLVAGAVLS